MTAFTNVRTIAVVAMAATLGGCLLPGSRGGGGSAGGGALFSVMFITREPPPERVEVVSRRPNDESVWVGGHWAARGNNYTWSKGRWERPAAGTKEWEPGRWAHESHGWYYTEGHWH